MTWRPSPAQVYRPCVPDIFADYLSDSIDYNNRYGMLPRTTPPYSPMIPPPYTGSGCCLARPLKRATPVHPSSGCSHLRLAATPPDRNANSNPNPHPNPNPTLTAHLQVATIFGSLIASSARSQLQGRATCRMAVWPASRGRSELH